MHAKRFFFTAVLSILYSSLLAQFKSNIGDTTVNATLLQISYTKQFPAAHMADRFGDNNCMGASLSFKVSHNWIFGFEGSILFGGNIREDTILDGLFTSEGFLIGVNGIAESVILFERGYAFWGKFGKLFPISEKNPNSGISVMIGGGFLQHKIKIEDPGGVVPYVTGDYAKGYDRLTNGFAVSQSITYLHLDNRRFLNFNAGLEVIEGFTQNRRDYNFDQMKKDDSKRVDVLVGIKIGWVLPFYGRGEERFYTY